MRSGERSDLTPAPLPITTPVWAVAGYRASRDELREMLGPPHYTETDSRRTRGGEEDCWGFVQPGDGRLLIVLDVVTGHALIYSDRPEAGPALQALGLNHSDPRVRTDGEPVLMQ
jgi:hypothetical protein